MLKKFKNILYPAIVVVFFAFTFQGNPPGGWYQQIITGIGTSTIKDMTFIDSLTGYVVTSFDSNNNSYILKTTNSGDNWFINYTVPNQRILQKVKFININTGFVNLGYNELYKTTNAGNNWIIISLPMDLYSEDISVLNEDTMWLAQSTPLIGGVFKTTNGGQNWIKQFGGTNNNPSRVYFYDANLGFFSNGALFRTSNGGINWMQMGSEQGFTRIKFLNSLTGWKAGGPAGFKKTTTGGLNWITQVLPQSKYLTTSVNDFSILNKDTVWAAGGWVIIPPTQERGILYQTTNGGETWRYQIPDTSINIFQYYFCQFYNKRIGWAYVSPGGKTGIHTIVGGDTTFLTDIKQITNLLPTDYELHQNYPNPFNPLTKITFSVKRQSSNVKLKVFDLTGKVINELVNKKLSNGTYEVDFNASILPSGVYFYSLYINNNLIDTKKMMLLK